MEGGENQPVKLFSRAAKNPAEVCVAATADRHLPRPTREPRERRLGRAAIAAAGSRDEASDVVRDAVRVDEGVLVRPTTLDAIRSVGDHVLAHDTAQCVVIRADRCGHDIGLFLRHECRLYLTRHHAIR